MGNDYNLLVDAVVVVLDVAKTENRGKIKKNIVSIILIVTKDCMN